MSKEIKQKADELVEMFYSSSITKYEATETAILHQRRLIDACRSHFHYCTDYLEEQKAILTELQYRL